MNLTKTINAYFATLIITIFGAGASLVIVHIASSDTAKDVILGNEATYLK